DSQFQLVLIKLSFLLMVLHLSQPFALSVNFDEYCVFATPKYFSNDVELIVIAQNRGHLAIVVDQCVLIGLIEIQDEDWLPYVQNHVFSKSKATTLCLARIIFTTSTVGYDCFEIMDELEGGAQGRKYFVKLIETGVHYGMNSVKYLKQADKERAEKEMAEIKKLESKYNVGLVYTFQDHTDMYMIMEYCENGDLLKVISELQQFSDEERVMRVCGIFGQMIRALDFLHCNGVIHWDIKPANIFVMIDRSVRLGDFGLTRDLVGDYYLKKEETNQHSIRCLHVQEV
ncbi:MAG: hypothetical protein EZS28_035176, partial [Streblomastix strix]